jgi:hypothetical protein
LNSILPQCGQNIQSKWNINYTQLKSQVGHPQKFRCTPGLAVIFVNCEGRHGLLKHLKVLVKIFWLSLYTLFFYGSHFRARAFIVEVQHKNIRTVGDLSRLDEKSVNRLPIATPKISHARTVLQVSRNSDFIFARDLCSCLSWLIDCEWVWDLTVPLHLGLNYRALCAPYQFMGALLLC